MITATITSTEQLRGELQGLNIMALTADPDVSDVEAAKIALGLHARAEPDGPPPSCGWCGRHAPDGGLEDQSLNGPTSFECNDSAGCQATRTQQEGFWLDRQTGKLWRTDLDKIRRIQQYEAEQSVRNRYGGGIYALSQDVEDPEFVLALAHIRQMVDQRAEGYGELFERVGELALSAGTAENRQHPVAAVDRPESVKFDPWSHTLAAAHNRTHLLGHHLQHKGVTDAASALARKKVQAEQAEDSS